jgi:hypothetical protein
VFEKNDNATAAATHMRSDPCSKLATKVLFITLEKIPPLFCWFNYSIFFDCCAVSGGRDFISLKKDSFYIFAERCSGGPDSSVKPLFRRRDASPPTRQKKFFRVFRGSK